MGILQITEMQDGKAPRHFKIRYKMLRVQEPIPSLSFGSVTEFEFKKPTWIDFEGHSAYSGTAARGKKSVDVKIYTGRDVIYVEGEGTTFALIANQEWDDLTPYEVWHALAQSQGEESLVVRQYPTNYAFQTREGRMGLIQVWGPFPARIRYKMLQEQVENPSIANALSVAEAFLTAAVSGRDSDAIKLVKPGSAVVEQIKNFQEIDDKDKLKVVSVYGDEEVALVTTTEIRVEDKGTLLIRLIKQRGMWMVEDIDLETPVSLKTELDSFFQKHPNATKLHDVQNRYKMLRPAVMKETVKMNVGKPVYEWWTSEPIVTKTIFENSHLEINWEITSEVAGKIEVFCIGVMAPKIDIHDFESFQWLGIDIPVTARSTPYGKNWKGIAHEIHGPEREAKPLFPGEYRIILFAFANLTSNRIWSNMLKNNLHYVGTAKLIVRPRPSTQIAMPRKAKSPIDLSTPEATIKSFVKAVYVGNLEAAKACVSKDGHDYDEFMEMLATESNHPFQAMIKAMDASIPVEITSKDITEDRCKIKWYFTLGRVYYIGDGETKWQKGKHPEFSSYLELVGDKWLIRDI
jgi:hypothetical protein